MSYRMTHTWGMLRPLTAALFAVFVACGGDEGDKGGSADATPEVTFGIGGTSTPDSGVQPPDTIQPGANVLVYAPEMLGSDGQPCSASCALRLSAGEDLDLAVVYRDGNGDPLADIQISWDAGDTPTDLGSLSALSSYTDDQGLARVTLRSGGLAGSATIKARVSGDGSVPELSFVVTYDAPEEPDLVVSFEYLGAERFVGFQLRLFERAGGNPSCAAVHPDSSAAVAPALTLGPFEPHQQIRVDMLPGLAAAGSQSWVVQLIGPYDQSGGRLPLAAGCVEDVVAQAGRTASTIVYVRDLPKHFRGVYETTTRLDSLSGGEGTAIGDVLITLSELFTRPGRLLVVWACGENPSGTLGTVCGWVTNGQGEPNVLGGIITDAADAALLALFEEAVGPDIQDASELISEMLRDLRLIATTTFDGEPATPKQGFEGAAFAPGAVHEVWTHVRFRWKHDPLCKNSPTPYDCGWTAIPLEQVYGQRPTAEPDAGIDGDLALHVDEHQVTRLTYGPLINAIIEWRILPLVFASGGEVPLDSWDDFVATLFGDRVCLDYDDCCEYFATRLEDSSIAFVVDFETRVLACELAIPLVAQVIRGKLQGLDGALTLGTPADAPCPAIDGDSDRWVDAYGAQATPCRWDLHFPIDGRRFEPDNDWRAIAR